MTLKFDPSSLVWNRFDGLEPVDPAWQNDIAFWEDFNASFFNANDKNYEPARDSNVAHWVTAEDRASFSDMFEALAPRLANLDLHEIDMVILAHWLPDLHLGTSVTNFVMHHLSLVDCMGFAISDRGVSASLFAFDLAAKVIANGEARKVLLLVMDQKTLLYKDSMISELKPDNVAAAMVLGDENRGMLYQGYARRMNVAESDLGNALADVRYELDLSDRALVLGPAALPGAICVETSLLCAAPFVAFSQQTLSKDVLLATWQFGTLTALGFKVEVQVYAD